MKHKWKSSLLGHPWLALPAFLLITWGTDACCWAQGPRLHSCMSAWSTDSQSQLPPVSWTLEAFRSYLFSTRLLVKGAPDSTSGICLYWGKILSIECDAVKQSWLFWWVGSKRECGWGSETGIASLLGPRRPLSVVLVLCPRVWLPRTGKEQAGEPEILIAGHVAHESTRKTAPHPPFIISFQ